MTTNWKYAPAPLFGGERVVYRTNADGSMESHLETADCIQEWLAAGNTIDTADEQND